MTNEEIKPGQGGEPGKDVITEILKKWKSYETHITVDVPKKKHVGFPRSD